MSEVASNLQKVMSKVDEAVRLAGRSQGEVQLMAVSKTWPAEHVIHAVDAGHRVFGENKIQEGEVKVPELPSSLEWHMIGHLQRNKVRKCLALFDYIHSVDSLKLLRYMDGVASDLGLQAKVFLQVNMGEEAQKTGFIAAEMKQSYEDMLSLENISIEGLMCIPPAAERAEDSRKWFAATRELRDSLETHFTKSIPGLSMGMSSDYAVAIEEGATIVRVGSSIFGSRSYH